MSVYAKLNKIIHSRKYLKYLKDYSKNFRKSLVLLTFIDILLPLLGILTIVLFQKSVDAGVYDNGKSFFIYLIPYAVISISVLFLSSYVSYRRSILNEKMSYKIQNAMFNNFFSQNWRQLTSSHSGDIITKLTRDTSALVSFYNSLLPSFMALIVQLVVAYIIISKYDNMLGLFTLTLTPLVIVINYFFGKKIKPFQNEINENEGNYRSFLTETIQNFTVVKSFQNENHKHNHLIELQNIKLKVIQKKSFLIIFAHLFIQIGFSIMSIIALTWGIYRISLGEITFGVLIAFIQLVSKIQLPIMGLSKLMPKYISVLSAVDRCRDLLGTTPLAQTIHCPSNVPIGIEINNLSFSYSKENKVFEHFNLKIEPNEKVALVGYSGVGKTTLMRLIMNFMTPSVGEINLYSSDTDYKNNIEFYTYVPQSNTLFTGTIKDNLLIGNPNASDEELYEALDHSCAIDYINQLPLKIDTNVGEKGLGFSEGQIQRICIARALLRQAPILLLDEATSALDVETEELLISNLKHYTNKTVVAITHRPSILSIMDRVIYLNEENKLLS